MPCALQYVSVPLGHVRFGRTTSARRTWTLLLSTIRITLPSHAFAAVLSALDAYSPTTFHHAHLFTYTASPMPLFASHAFRSCAARIVIGLSAVPFLTPFAQSMSGMPFVPRVYLPSPTTSVS